ncbi:MAG: MarR family winged helix-turn-helix transcriptional regulator [Lysobacteraceae bacterium]
MAVLDLSSHPAFAAGLPPQRAERVIALEKALRQTTALSTLMSEAVSRRLGMSSTDLECMDLLCARGPMTAGQLAEASGLSSGAVTGLLDRLEAAGFVARERDESDRRKVVVCILPHVEDAIAPYYGELQEAFLAVCAGYSDDELALLEGFFQRCSELGSRALARLGGMPPAEAPKTGGDAPRVRGVGQRKR